MGGFCDGRPDAHFLQRPCGDARRGGHCDGAVDGDPLQVLKLSAAAEHALRVTAVGKEEAGMEPPDVASRVIARNT